MNRFIALLALAILFGACGTDSIASKRGTDPAPNPDSEESVATESGETTVPKAAFCPKGAIKGPMRQRISEFRACYENELKERPKLEGRVDTLFSVGRDGRAGRVSTQGLLVVGACIAKVIQSIQFPWRHGCPDIKWPFVFKLK